MAREGWPEHGSAAEETAAAARSIAASPAPATAVQVRNRMGTEPPATPSAPPAANLIVYFAGEGAKRTFTFAQVNGEGKSRTLDDGLWP